MNRMMHALFGWATKFVTTLMKPDALFRLRLVQLKYNFPPFTRYNSGGLSRSLREGCTRPRTFFVRVIIPCTLSAFQRSRCNRWLDRTLL